MEVFILLVKKDGQPKKVGYEKKWLGNKKNCKE